jgi:hypothetical protein
MGEAVSLFYQNSMAQRKRKQRKKLASVPLSGVSDTSLHDFQRNNSKKKDYKNVESIFLTE